MNDGAKSVLMAVGITFAIRLVYDLGKKLGRKAKKEESK